MNAPGMSTDALWHATQQLAYDEACWYVYLPFDDHSLDAEDWWLFVACCCKVAERMCVAVKEGERVRLLHTGREVMSRLNKIYVETYLDDIDDDFRESFLDPQDLQKAVDQASKLTKRRGIVGWNWHGPQRNELKDFNKPEALRLKLQGDWSFLTRNQDPCAFHNVRQEDMTRHVLFDLPLGLTAQEGVLWRRSLFSSAQPMVSFPPSWLISRGQFLKLITSEACCAQCGEHVDEDNIVTHLVQCSQCCRSCGSHDHRVCQTINAVAVHVGRKAILEMDDSTFVFGPVTSCIFPDLKFCLLMKNGICSHCYLLSGSQGCVTKRSLSSSIMIAQANDRDRVRQMISGFDTGSVLFQQTADGFVGVRLSSSGVCCQTCGLHANALTRLRLCAQCKNVRYCSSTCQKQDWNRHKQDCLTDQDVLGLASLCL